MLNWIIRLLLLLKFFDELLYDRRYCCAAGKSYNNWLIFRLRLGYRSNCLHNLICSRIAQIQYVFLGTISDNDSSYVVAYHGLQSLLRAHKRRGDYLELNYTFCFSPIEKTRDCAWR